jgi:GT2 family glycosyltransferase
MLLSGLPGDATEIRNPIGTNMAFRRSVLEQVGGFTDGIGRVGRTPLGCEETELSIRARAATGGRIVQLHDANVEHRVSTERARWRYFRQRCRAEGLSKAIVSRSVGSDAALASERSYVLRTWLMAKPGLTPRWAAETSVTLRLRGSGGRCRPERSSEAP